MYQFLGAQRFNNLWNAKIFVKRQNIRAKKGQFETPKKTELDVKKTSILKVPVLKKFCRYWLSTKVCGEIRRKVIIEIIVSQNYLSFGVLKSVVKVNVPLYHLASGEVKVPHHATRSVENSCR